MIAGSVDIGVAAGIMGALSAFSKGAPVRIIGNEITGAGDLFWYVKADSPIKTLAGRQRQDHRLFDQRLLHPWRRHRLRQAISACRRSRRRPAARPRDLTAVMSGQVDVGWAAPPFGLDQLDRNEIRQIATGNDTLFKGQTVRLLITNAADPVEPQGRDRSLHAGLSRDRRLDVLGSRALKSYAEFVGITGGKGEAHPR